ncbi:MAG: Hint domain-containing protein [Paracoccaceae bacterium]
MPGADKSPDELLVQGSLVMETRVPATNKLQPLLIYNQTGEWPLHLALHAIPGGGLSLVLDQGGMPLHQSVNHSETGRTETLRITYAWDARNRWAQLSVERPEDDRVLTVPVQSPRPLRLADAKAILKSGPSRFVSPEIEFMALSSAIEPIGPMPSLAMDTPIATPTGYVPLKRLRRGDLVLNEERQAIPVLSVISRTVPACGSFRPLRIRAPFFGLWHDVDMSPNQRLLLRGSEVEYMFGRPAVLLSTRHLVGTPRTYFPDAGDVVTYGQIILPNHEVIETAGAFTESLFVGRLRRNRELLQRTLLRDIDRHTLPEHAKPIEPVLRAFDATVLAERSVA